ncbi:uncharacterized protein [Nicotiana sylvestris]|uniref:uncharacterized protein n=1 Tax=Nicotiana sylvestris TaxID=4096 RepID=UPI00388CEACC
MGRWVAKNHGLGKNIKMRPPLVARQRLRSPARARREKERQLSTFLPQRNPGLVRVTKGCQEANTIKAMIPLKVGGPLANIFDGARDSVGLDIPIAVKSKDMFDHALVRLREELSYHEGECKTLTLILRDSKAHSARGEKELGELRAALERALWEKADLTAQVEQNVSQISRLNAEILGLRKQSEVATEELVSSLDLLKDARKEVATLVAAKSEIERNATTYLDDAVTTHKIACDVSIAIEHKLAQAINHAKAEARRETLEEIGARGIDMSVDLEEARELERELAFLIVLDESPGDGFCKDVSCGHVFGNAFDKLKFELFHCEALLREALGWEKSLNLLCVEKESELVSLQREVDRSRSHEICLEKKTVCANDSTRENMITRLSAELSKEKAEVVNVLAEVVMGNTMTGQKAATYLKSAAVAKADLKRALNLMSSSKEYARCKSQREVLEEIHASGFDLIEEIEQAKGEEYAAKFLLSDVEDGEEGAAGPLSWRGAVLLLALFLCT